MNELDALRFVDFEWAVHFNEVWRAPAVDVPDLHARLRAEFARKLDAMERKNRGSSPLGWVVAGSGGTGKTHLLGAFRREATRRGVPFIMVDMTDVHDFWECVLQGYVDSLQVEVDGGPPQYRRTLANIIERLGPNNPVAEVLAALSHRKSRNQRDDANRVLSILNKCWPRETMKYQNVIRALVCVNSDDFTYTNIGRTWLQGVELEDEQRRELGFMGRGERPSQIVEALSWILSLGGPVVLAFDQLDASIEQLHNHKFGPDDDDRATTARAILAGLGGGLLALRDITRNTLAIISCVESTWDHLRGVILGTSVDRFEAPHRLKIAHDDAIARALVEGRLATAHRESGFAPPHPTYPFRSEAFQDLRGATPREILKKCKAHFNTCFEQDSIHELSTFNLDRNPETHSRVSPPDLDRLDAEFQRLRSKADPAWLLEEKHDDDRLAPLILCGLGCLVAERDLGPNVSAIIDAELTGGAKTRPLHARLRLIHHDQNEREEHFCVRALQWTNDRAFQSRLKAALTQSGIDRNLNFRRLTVIRSFPNPNGAISRELIEKFNRDGGVLIKPAEDDLRTLSALHHLKTRKDAALAKWLHARRPASSLGLIQKIVGAHSLFFEAPAEVLPPNGESKPTKEKRTPPNDPIGKTGGSKIIDHSPIVFSNPQIPLGRRLQAGKPTSEIVGIPIKSLDRHSLIIAGSGSGKTVFLKRLIEEAALAGVPSIVIDPANDLVALDERWEESPAEWADDDRRKAEAFHVPGRVVVWTPGRESGNPLSLEPVPDLAPLADDADELETAVSMVVDALSPLVAKGESQTATYKRGLLKKAVRYQAGQGGGRLAELIDLLSDLPPEAGLGLVNESKLARGLAGGLKVAREMNPLLRSVGTPIDPAVLFGLDQRAAPARVSVVSLVGLPGLDAQRNFVNQLAMSLFAWIKENPDYGDQPLRGLLVIDEAKDFAPSQKASASGESLARLTAQARKYGLALVFATQNPKDINHTIVANCSTNLFGKINSPAAIQPAQEMIRGKGGTGEDISNLPAGRFYYHNADAGLTKPVKILTSICLSRHPRTPLDESTILAKAAASRPTPQAIVN